MMNPRFLHLTFSTPLADFPSESRTLQWPDHCLPVLVGRDKDRQAVEGLLVTGGDRISLVCKDADKSVEAPGDRKK